MEQLPYVIVALALLSGVSLGAGACFAASLRASREPSNLRFIMTCVGFSAYTLLLAIVSGTDSIETDSLLLRLQGVTVCWTLIWMTAFGAAMARRRVDWLDKVIIAGYAALAVYSVQSPSGYWFASVDHIETTVSPLTGMVKKPVGQPLATYLVSIVLQNILYIRFVVDGVRLMRFGARQEGGFWLSANLLLFLATTNDHAIDFGFWNGFYIGQWVFLTYLATMGVRLVLRGRREHRELLLLNQGLSDQEQLYRALFTSAGDAILVFEERLCVECNARAADLFGVAPEALLGKSALDLSPEKQPEGDSRVLAQARVDAALSGQRQQFLWINRRGNGEEFQSEVSLTKVGGGGPTRLIAVIRDMTPRKRAEQERMRMERAAMASQRLALLGQLAAGVAHEFRNPLHGVTQYLSMLQRKATDRDKVIEYSQMIDEGLRRMENVSDRLLRLGREGTGKKRSTDLGEVITSTVGLIHVIARKKNISLDFRCDTPARLDADSPRLSEALLHLLQNAVDACGKDDRITVSLNADESNAIITVSDTGPGIPLDIRDRIFEPFFTTKPLGEGTGLGLTIVRQILQEHGGSAEIAAGQAQGARFVLKLPLAGSTLVPPEQAVRA